MKKKFSVLSCAIVVMALMVTVGGVKLFGQVPVKNDVSYAVLEQYYDDADDMNTTMANEPTEEATTSGSSSGGLGDLLGGLGGSGDFGGGLLDGIGGIGGIFGDAGDILGSLIGGSGGGSGSGSTGTLNTTVGGNDYIYIDPVPAATTQVQSQSTNSSETAQTTIPVAETVNPLATTNPYARPTGEIKPGDMGDGVKWIQWNLIYTGYGLQGKEITGVYDNETVEVIKKLQAEKGLTPDGIINDDDIAATELLYYEYIINAQTTLPQTTVVDSTGVTTIGSVEDDNDNNGGKWLKIIIAVVLIAFIWIVAFIVIAIILIVKKKNAKKTPVAQPAKVQEKTENKNGDMSLSDLFEEANNKKK